MKGDPGGPMPKKLLLAEDSLTIRKVFELALFQTDVTVTAVDNGEDAVRLAGEIAPDLVVADVTLPGRNGYQVAEELRAMEKTSGIPVLILSGSVVPLDEARFKACGAAGVLFKPFESRDLLEKIDQLLREKPPAPAHGETLPAAPEDEKWDFSDILEEVEEEAGVPTGAPASPSGEKLLPGAVLPGGVRTAAAFNEFDVSIDEIDSEPAPAPKVDHIEGGVTGDSPPPVTELSPMMDGIEEIEEIEGLEEVELPSPASSPVLEGSPASLRILSGGEDPASAAPPVAAAPEIPPVAPRVPEPEPAVAAAPVTPVEAAAPVDSAAPGAAEAPSQPCPPSLGAPESVAVETPVPPDEEFRKRFGARAEEIFRTVAAEAVEKVMWEMTERLSAEWSAKMRESVESVAWEVIPATAEALIREEIARIRTQAGKPSP
ncbi:MAG: hypothetical protein OHK0028_11320 [Deltaproteobacteria bacterium]